MFARKDLSVGAERIGRWLAGFEERHGATTYAAEPSAVVVTAADGSVAEVEVPFPPLEVDQGRPYGGLLEHAGRDRKVGVLLVRRGGYAAGVFHGGELVASKVGSRLVQGRTAAGGWSQQRFARRREKQAREAFEAAANVAANVLLPHARELDALVLGGDKAATQQVLEDPRLAELRELVATVPTVFLNVPDPKLAVLRETPKQFRVVRIRLSEISEIR
jgi:hypothetical protein